MRRVVLLVLVAGALLIPVSARSASTSCPSDGTSVPAGADIQSYLTAGAPGSAFCLAAGTYHPAATLQPQADQSLYGVAGSTVIDGRSALSAIFDGTAGSRPTGVGLYDLTLQHATGDDVRTWDGWILSGITATGAQVGVNLRTSDNPATSFQLLDSTIEHNSVFGVKALKTVGGLVQGNTIAYNNLPTNDPNFSGGTHFNVTSGLQVLGNIVHDNYGRGLWFDIGTYGATIKGNDSFDNLDYAYPNVSYPVGDGIRVEISCNSIVEDNTSHGNQGPQIAIDGSDHVAVLGNTVNAPPGNPGIRVSPQDNRSSVPSAASTYCDQTLRTAVHDAVTNNDITLQGHLKAKDYDGIQQRKATSDTTGTSFDANAYHVYGCSRQLWHWWDPTLASLVMVPFATFQGTYGQEGNGSCSAS